MSKLSKAFGLGGNALKGTNKIYSWPKYKVKISIKKM